MSDYKKVTGGIKAAFDHMQITFGKRPSATAKEFHEAREKLVSSIVVAIIAGGGPKELVDQLYKTMQPD